ncbi:MAG: M50 family metallopeptidase [Polyangiaceae bacterium]|nr:M50 family metallopeptidase [Polyangiaceae bacterium]
MLASAFGLALLMIVHESGHYFAARAFGMRVDRFSIGFGPSIIRHRPKGSDTVFQVALIPFLAYVQISGMNPFEEIDPEDKGSYANASLVGRISAILAGPAANYVFAALIFFSLFLFIGKYSERQVEVVPDRAAAAAGMQSGDTILSIEGQDIKEWKQIPSLIQPNAGKSLQVVVQRNDQPINLEITPQLDEGVGRIGILPERVPRPIGEAAWLGITRPAKIIQLTVESLARVFTGKEKAQFSGPIGMFRETSRAAEEGLVRYLSVIGYLSTALAFFNMLPFPALDGGRFMFLIYEAVTRRRANQKVEGQIHIIGILVLLSFMAMVSYREWGQKKAPSEIWEDEQKAKAAAEEAEKKKTSTVDSSASPAPSGKTKAQDSPPEPEAPESK